MRLRLRWWHRCWAGLLSAVLHRSCRCGGTVSWLDVGSPRTWSVCAPSRLALPYAQLDAYLVAAGSAWPQEWSSCSAMREGGDLAAAAALVAIAWRAHPTVAPATMRAARHVPGVGQGDASCCRCRRARCRRPGPSRGERGRAAAGGTASMSFRCWLTIRSGPVGGAEVSGQHTRRGGDRPEAGVIGSRGARGDGRAKEHRVPVVTARPGLE